MKYKEENLTRAIRRFPTVQKEVDFHISTSIRKCLLYDAFNMVWDLAEYRNDYRSKRIRTACMRIAIEIGYLVRKEVPGIGDLPDLYEFKGNAYIPVKNWSEWIKPLNGSPS